jgi:TetR/AcrR family transcriptional regulator, cholesterol catabolism regulator
MTSFSADRTVRPGHVDAFTARQSIDSAAMSQLQVEGESQPVEGLADLLGALDAISHTTSEIRVDTRERILEASIPLFARRGFEACTVKEIATEVGIKPPGLYAHFASKEAILAAAMSRQLRKFLAAVLSPNDGPDPRVRLEGIVRRHVAYQITNLPTTVSNDLLLNNDAAKNALGEDTFRLLRRAQRAYVDHVEQLIIASGASTTPHPRVTALALLSLCDHVTTWYRTAGSLTPQQVNDDYWALSARMLGFS